jgi:Tol biopolymer transport system component
VAGTFAAALATGAAYQVSQLAGPRTCTLSANRSGTAAGADIVVSADCGQPPAVGALSGRYFGPVGAQIVLRASGVEDLTLTLPTAGNTLDPYNQLDFAFTPPLADGTAYQVQLLTPAPDHQCAVFGGASGTMPVAATTVRVGCEVTHDLVSRSSASLVRGSYFDSSAPVVGGADVALGTTTQAHGEGRFVAFVSSAALAGNTGAHRQVYWRDRLTGVTRLVSATPAGAEGNGDSGAPSISADGLTVAFESLATNLDGSDTNGVSDVFVWRALDAGAAAGARRVSLAAGGGQADGASSEPVLSGDGSVLAWTSTASNLAAGVSGTTTPNVYRRVLAGGTTTPGTTPGTTPVTTLVSRDAQGKGVGGARPAISEDGNRLAFWSAAATLVAGDVNGLWDIFVHDQAGASLQRVSLTSSGGERDQGSESASRVVAPAISGNGRFVAYASTATNVVPDDTNGVQDVFVVDTATGAVTRASVSTGGVQGNADSPAGQGERVALSADGRQVAFSTLASNLGPRGNNVVLRDLAGGTTQALSDQGTSSVGPVMLSRRAGYAVFGSGSALDPRYNGSGLYARYTGLVPGFSWLGF